MKLGRIVGILLGCVFLLAICPGALAREAEGSAQLQSLMDAMDLIEQHFLEPKNKCELVAGAKDVLEETYGVIRPPQVQRQQATILQGNYTERLGLACLQVLVDTMNEIRRSGKQEDLTPICNSAIEGMVATLDGRSIYLSSEDAGEEASGVDLVPDRTASASIEVETLAPGYHYVQIKALPEDLLIEFARKMVRLRADTSLKGLVVDLRHNGDGPLGPAARFADLFLDHGLIVSVRGRDEPTSFSVQADRPMGFKGIPLVLLVNEGTGGGAEIIASALHENKRAVLVGGRTRGRGTIANLFPLKNGHALMLTTAALYTASGAPIERNPIVPDLIVVPGSKDNTIQLAFDLLRSAESPSYEDLLEQAHLLGGREEP